jgi:hypothetical protein
MKDLTFLQIVGLGVGIYMCFALTVIVCLLIKFSKCDDYKCKKKGDN